MAYTTIDDPSAYFQTTLYTGNGGTNAITNTGNSDLQPDWIWFKRRDGADNHILFDVIRGVTKGIYADIDNAQDNLADSLSSFNSDGFTLGADTGSGGSINGSSETNVAWQWKAGGSASSNSDGSITSSVSASTDAGFSIVSYTGNATNGATVGHGLGAVPEMLIGKDLSDTSGWGVWNKDLTNGGYRLTLSTTDAQSDDTALFGGSSRTVPTSSVFTLGSGGGLNGANANIIYAFSSVKGYSKIGSYTGNGNLDGPFCFTGFKPAFVLGKRTDSAGGWWLSDNKRSGGFNLNDEYLVADSNNAEQDDGSFASDFLSNGWKARATNGNFNADGGKYIYMAFAESPFVTSTGVPATAR